MRWRRHASRTRVTHCPPSPASGSPRHSPSASRSSEARSPSARAASRARSTRCRNRCTSTCSVRASSRYPPERRTRRSGSSPAPPVCSHTRRIRAIWAYSARRASSGGLAPQTRLITTSTATGRPASTASAASTVRRCGGPTSVTWPRTASSTGPSSRKSTTISAPPVQIFSTCPAHSFGVTTYRQGSDPYLSPRLGRGTAAGSRPLGGLRIGGGLTAVWGISIEDGGLIDGACEQGVRIRCGVFAGRRRAQCAGGGF